MKHVRKNLISLLMAGTMLFGATALGEGCYVGCDRCASDFSCNSCAYCTAVTATARPRGDVFRPQVTGQPVYLHTPAPTRQPSATGKPAALPTARPQASIAPKPQATSFPSISMGDYTTFSLSTQEKIAFTLLNQDRVRNGLPALTLDAELSRIARIKCQDMKDNRYFAHESPTYGRAAQMLTHFGYSYNGVGENIAHHATVEKSQAAFMSSQAHRINALGKQWKKVGIGVVYDAQGFVYVTQLFVR